MRNRRRAYRRGHRAEKLAALLLLLKGYRIVARRYSSPYGEIDLIARRGRSLVFVEVKARPTKREALESITSSQRQRIAAAARAYLQSRQESASLLCRFDVITYSPPLRLKHLINAWQT